MNITLEDIYQTYNEFTKKKLIEMVIARNEALLFQDAECTSTKNEIQRKITEIARLKQEIELLKK